MDAALFVEHRLAQAHEVKAATAFPLYCLADAALFTIDHLLQAWQAVGGRVFAHLDTDPAPAHLVCYCGRGAGTEEAVEDEVAGIRTYLQDALKKAFGLWGSK